jgi:hypothetical protein
MSTEEAGFESKWMEHVRASPRWRTDKTDRRPSRPPENYEQLVIPGLELPAVSPEAWQEAEHRAAALADRGGHYVRGTRRRR